MNHVIQFHTRQQVQLLVEDPDHDPYASSYTSVVRETTGMGVFKAAVQSDSPGQLIIDGAMDGSVGPWHELYRFSTLVDPNSGLNVVSFSAPTDGFKYARVRYVTIPTATLGVNFNIRAHMNPVA